MAEIIEKYVNFKNHGHFFPMINPYEILQHGAHEGMFFSIDNLALYTLSELMLDKIRSTVFDSRKYASPKPVVEINHYKALEETPPFVQLFNGKPMNSYNWLLWYFKFYEGVRNKEVDELMIRWWAIVCNWGTNEAQGSPNIDQMLLHYAWAPGWKWRGKLDNYVII